MPVLLLSFFLSFFLFFFFFFKLHYYQKQASCVDNQSYNRPLNHFHDNKSAVTFRVVYVADTNVGETKDVCSWTDYNMNV